MEGPWSATIKLRCLIIQAPNEEVTPPISKQSALVAIKARIVRISSFDLVRLRLKFCLDLHLILKDINTFSDGFELWLDFELYALECK